MITPKVKESPKPIHVAISGASYEVTAWDIASVGKSPTEVNRRYRQIAYQPNLSQGEVQLAASKSVKMDYRVSPGSMGETMTEIAISWQEEIEVHRYVRGGLRTTPRRSARAFLVDRFLGEAGGLIYLPLPSHRKWLEDLGLSVALGEVSPLDAATAFDERFPPENGDEDEDEDGVKSPSFAPWGIMQISNPPLTKTVVAGIHGNLSRPEVEGVYPRFIHRWVSDKAILTTPRPRGRGSVLVDMSTSMHISEADVENLVVQSNGVIVAGYAGLRRYEDAGDLAVLAKGGRMVKKIPYLGGGNVVDGPALEWLAKQPPPRIWVSDGGVTGVGDAINPLLDEEVASLLKSSRIVRVRYPGDALRLLEKRGGRWKVSGSAESW